MNSQRAWWVWGVGVFAYIAAVTQRTSFGVAGIDATERFGTTAATLSIFSVVQLLVYAGLQVPVGVLVDKFGARVMLAAGASLMLAGQLQLALASSVPEGILGRVLVGAGDATTFISVLRLVPAWFEGRRIPMLIQWTGMLGQLGQIISVVPFAAILNNVGWSPAFVSVAALSVLSLVLTLAVVRSYPPHSTDRPEPSTWRQTGVSVVRVWQQPGTRLGLWSHFTTQFAGNVFIFTWGYPFLISAQGLDPTTAAALMSIFVVVAIVCGPMFGYWAARHPLRRSSAVIAVGCATAAAWAAVLLYPGRAPLWLLIVLVGVLAIGAPGSMLGFDIARTFNPAHRIGTATGIVNVGGFFAALSTMFLVGVILDLLFAAGYSGGDLYALDSFRIALCVHFVVIAIGITGILVTRRKVRTRMAAEGVRVPTVKEVLVRERSRRRERRGT